MTCSRLSFLGCLRFLSLALFIATGLCHALTVTDDAGAQVTLAAPAQRVISLAPHITELIYAAGAGQKLVGAVSYSDYPPEALRIPRVGDYQALDLERIAALKPDLIILWRHGNAQQQLDALRALQVPIFESQPRMLDDVASSLIKLGILLGTTEQAKAAANAYRRDIARLRQRYAARPIVKVFYQVWSNPLMTLNGANMVSDVITLCGGRNIFASLSPVAPTLSTEAVLAQNPEAIVTASAGATPPSTPLPGLDQWRAWPALTAVARNNLFAIDGDLISRPAPRIAQGATQLCADLELARARRAPRLQAHEENR